MDFRSLSRAMARQQSTSNASLPLNLTELPPTILDTLVPGYSLISRYALAVFGVDISIFVTLAVVSLAATKGSQFLMRQAEVSLRYFFVSSVYIDEHDDLFDMVMAWLAKNQGPASRRSVRAKTQRGHRAQAELDESYDAMVDDALDEKGMFDFNKWSARMPPRFEPYYGRHRLAHDGHWFLIQRRQHTGDRMQIQWGAAPEDDIIQIDCLGRTIAPIEDLLRTIKVWSLSRMRYTTVIRHPTPKDRGRFSGAWSKTSSRPSRPMDTVILDSEQKMAIVNDMNEYLHPASPKWYATRGIPYRRGYLFFGPPGTGKTSLSFALAGIFGLEIYAISLQEPSLTEGDLMQLFNALPRRCIVLLEDVDAAGLIRDGKSDAAASDDKKKGRKRKNGHDESDEAKKNDSVSDEKKKPEKDEDYTLRDLARELKAITAPRGGGRGEGKGNNDASGPPNRQPGAGISLSGLLNAIDGVATHEGRVLIMTTNHPEKLDSALVRPGRVDRRVEFRLAMKEQIRELFVRMYAATDETSIATNPVTPTANGHHANGSTKEAALEKDDKKSASSATISNHLSVSFSRPEIEEFAIEFASQLPDGTYTPAEIQNWLMRHKKDPRYAVDKVMDWVKEVEEDKEKVRKAKEEAEASDGEDGPNDS